MRPLMVSVPPLLERWVSKYPRNSWRHWFGGAAEAGDLGDGAGVEGRDDAFGDGASVGEPGLVVGRAQLLGALVGDLDLDVFVASCQRGL